MLFKSSTIQLLRRKLHGGKTQAAAPATAPSANLRIASSELGMCTYFDFQIKKQLGAGSFSRVFHAIHVPTGKQVALKITSKVNAKHVEDVRAEARAMQLLGNSHPNIVQMYGYFEDSARAFLVLEYVEGGNLNDYLSNMDGHLTERQCAKWFAQITSAVSFAHSKGIVSRDIKSANILLTPNGVCKLADFGLAATVDNVATATFTTSHGSPVYGAPEIYTAAKKAYVAEPAEVWALGVVLHCMLTRALPFDQATYTKTWGSYTAPANVTVPAQALLQSIFQLDAAARPDMEHLIASEWMVSEQKKNLPRLRVTTTAAPHTSIHHDAVSHTAMAA